MSQMTPGQTRVIDPILSEHARGYRSPNNVADVLFPEAPVAAYGGQVIEFGKEAFRLYSSKRAPGSNTKRISFGYAGKPYAIVPGALEALVPRELLIDAAQVPGVDLGARAINTVLRSLQLEREHAAATLARAAGNYAASNKKSLSGATLWRADGVDPSKDVEEGSEAIRAKIGMRPNVAILSPAAFSACKQNPKLIERIKYTGRDSVTTDLLSTLWEIPRVVVGEAVMASDKQNADFSDVWGTDVILAYATPGGSAAANAEEPSYGYTYVINGNPLVEQPYWDANAKSWVYGVSYDAVPVIAGADAGYLIQNAGGK